jgi:hypothetical protein
MLAVMAANTHFLSLGALLKKSARQKRLPRLIVCLQILFLVKRVAKNS